MDADRFERVEIRSEQALWDWLETNHDCGRSVGLVTWKAIRRERYVGRDAVLDALIAYGWIDGRRMKLDGERTMQLISPRRETRWAETYKQRAERLEAEGRMKDAGRRAIAKSKASGRWETSAPIDQLKAPADLLAALDRYAARAWWEDAARSYRRNVLRWIAYAKRDETRAKRIDTVAEHASRGVKVPRY